jgi:hypothetical protein
MYSDVVVCLRRDGLGESVAVLRVTEDNVGGDVGFGNQLVLLCI